MHSILVMHVINACSCRATGNQFTICFPFKGESVLKFAIHICKELQPGTPSLYQLKAIVLPGFIPPAKVYIAIAATVAITCIYIHAMVYTELQSFLQFYTPAGNPFYVNLPSTILRLALGSFDISRQLHRYPVYTHCGPLTSVTATKMLYC